MKLSKLIKSIWIALSISSLLLPLILHYSGYSAEVFEKAGAIAVAVMFILSLPSSIFFLPIFAGFWMVIELDTSSMEGIYLYLLTLNVIGYVQWFWLFPRFMGQGKEFSLPGLMLENE